MKRWAKASPASTAMTDRFRKKVLSMSRISPILRRAASLLLAAVLVTAAAGCFAEEKGVSSMFLDSLPNAYVYNRFTDGGKVIRITYPTKDYFGDQADIRKNALVYLPADYSEDVPCDVLILCHGVGGTEYEWNFSDLPGTLCGKNVTDRAFSMGYVKNLIIVLPNGRSTANFKDTSWNNMYAFYSFGQELRNDLIPYIDANFSTWGAKLQDDPAAARQHRAMAGLSMGGMQTINIGMCECLDLISAFGAFSAAPTSYTSAEIAAKLKAFPEDLDIRCFYNVCGLQDTTAYASASAAAKTKPADSRLTEDNWFWQEVDGVHDHKVWYLGLFNFLKLLGSMQE